MSQHIFVLFRKRSDYRRPSALGVPDAQLQKSSEYLSNFDKKNPVKKANVPDTEIESQRRILFLPLLEILISQFGL